MPKGRPKLERVHGKCQYRNCMYEGELKLQPNNEELSGKYCDQHLNTLRRNPVAKFDSGKALVGTMVLCHPLSEQHMHSLQKIMDNGEVMQYAYAQKPVRKDVFEQYFQPKFKRRIEEMKEKKAGYYMITNKSAEKKFGMMGFYIHEKEVAPGYPKQKQIDVILLMNPENQGKGIAKDVCLTVMKNILNPSVPHIRPIDKNTTIEVTIHPMNRKCVDLAVQLGLKTNNIEDLKYYAKHFQGKTVPKDFTRRVFTGNVGEVLKRLKEKAAKTPSPLTDTPLNQMPTIGIHPSYVPASPASSLPVCYPAPTNASGQCFQYIQTQYGLVLVPFIQPEQATFQPAAQHPPPRALENQQTDAKAHNSPEDFLTQFLNFESL